MGGEIALWCQRIGVPSLELSIPHISGQAEAKMNIGQPGHAAPQDHITGWQVASPIQIATEFG